MILIVDPFHGRCTLVNLESIFCRAVTVTMPVSGGATTREPTPSSFLDSSGEGGNNGTTVKPASLSDPNSFYGDTFGSGNGRR